MLPECPGHHLDSAFVRDLFKLPGSQPNLNPSYKDLSEKKYLYHVKIKTITHLITVSSFPWPPCDQFSLMVGGGKGPFKAFSQSISILLHTKKSYNPPQWERGRKALSRIAMSEQCGGRYICIWRAYEEPFLNDNEKNNKNLITSFLRPNFTILTF